MLFSKNKFIILLIIILIFSLFPQAVFATPNEDIDSTIKNMLEVQKELEQKTKELEIISENNALLEAQIKEKTQELEKINKEIYESEIKIEKLQKSAGEIAISYYKNDVSNSASMVLRALFESTSFTEIINTLEYAKRSYEYEAEILKNLNTAQENLALAQQNQVIIAQNLELFKIQYSQEQVEISKKVDDLQTIYNAHKKELNNLHALERAEQLAFLASITSSLDTTSTVSEARRKVVDTALQQLGKAYVWGAIGPDNFDCSGLMLYSYKSININVVRTSRQQYQMTQRIELKDLKPGDFVFLGDSPETIHHVMMYIGDGYTIEAPQTGDVVKIRPLSARFGSIIGYGTLFINE